MFKINMLKMNNTLKIDFGSGYNPNKGYKTCDIVKFPQLDYYYNLYTNKISGLDFNSVDEFYLRNVVHHIKNLETTFKLLKKYLKDNGTLKIIECRKENYYANYFLDRLWYRFVIPRDDIWFSNKYRDYSKILESLGFILINKNYIEEKEILTWKKLKMR